MNNKDIYTVLGFIYSVFGYDVTSAPSRIEFGRERAPRWAVRIERYGDLFRLSMRAYDDVAGYFFLVEGDSVFSVAHFQGTIDPVVKIVNKRLIFPRDYKYHQRNLYFMLDRAYIVIPRRDHSLDNSDNLLYNENIEVRHHE